MEQLLCHLVGDYILQNHHMAQRKVADIRWAVLHASLYMLPFLLLTLAWLPLLIMWGTHVLIDRYRLATVWTEWYGVGEPGRLWMEKYPATPFVKHSVVNEWYYKESAPDWLCGWLRIIADNTLHLAINFACLTYLT